MALLAESGISPLIVTLYIDILGDKVEDFRYHLDHHLKSDNWAKYPEMDNIYLKDSYIVQSPHDYKRTKAEFAKDLQDLFSVSTTQLIEHCPCAKPMRGIAQLGNLGHVAFTINFSATKKKFKVSCKEFKCYGDSPDLFAEYENL